MYLYALSNFLDARSPGEGASRHALSSAPGLAPPPALPHLAYVCICQPCEREQCEQGRGGGGDGGEEEERKLVGPRRQGTLM
jgi:hypothetical protein